METREEREKQGRFVGDSEGKGNENMQNFMDLADYSEKYESKVDMINDFREAQGMLGMEK